MYIVYVNNYTREVSILSSIEDISIAEYIVKKLKEKDSSAYKILSITDNIDAYEKANNIKYFYIIENFMLCYIKDR